MAAVPLQQLILGRSPRKMTSRTRLAPLHVWRGRESTNTTATVE